MPRPLKLKPRLNQHPYATLAAPDTTTALTLDRLTRCVPMPLDSVCLLLVCQAAHICLETAFKVIPDPTTAATKLLSDFADLAQACEEKYKAAGVTESLEMMRRRITTFPGWHALAFLGSHQIAPANSTLLAAGMELAIKLVDAGKQPVAPEFMRSLATDQIEYSLSTDTFVKQVHFDFVDRDDLPTWFPRSKKTYRKFLSIFSETPPPPPPPPTFEERATAQLLAHSARARFRLRASVLDTTMLSTDQVCKTFATQPDETPAELVCRQALLWFSGFSGLTWDLLQDIPFMTTELKSWVVCFDIDNGTLLRDFGVIAKDASRQSHGNDAAPASYISTIPAPASIWELLKMRRMGFALASKLGDLLPELLLHGSRTATYQTHGTFQPSYARWARTTGPLMRLKGIDNLLSSIMCGKFGNTARSKLYYCSVDPTEIWTACKLIYEHLSLGSPVEKPATLLNFGTGVVPSITRISQIDSVLVARAETLRPKGKAAAKSLINHHNAYVISLAFRFIFLLALRESTHLDLWADLDEQIDITVDIDDKHNNGLEGALPVVLSTHLKTLLKYYRLHCMALHKRLGKVGGCEFACDWLEDVCNFEHVPLLCLFTSTKRCRAVATADAIHEFADLAPDFGRKFQENWHRVKGAVTRDTDRQMRHEVLGQESYTSTAAHCEFNWVHRILPLLDEMASKAFAETITGLRTKL